MKNHLKLQEQASQIECKVFRDGKLEKISIEYIVKGDKILVQLEISIKY